MKRRSDNISLFISKAMLYAILAAVYFNGQIFFYEDSLFYFWGNVVLVLLYGAMIFLASRVYNGFNFGNATIYEIVIAWILCLAIVNVFQYFILSLLRAAIVIEATLLPAGGFAVIYTAQILLIIPASILLNMLYYQLHPAQKTLIIYGNKDKLQLCKTMIAKHKKRLEVVDTRSQSANTGTLLDAISKVQAVFFIDVEESKQDTFIEYCYLNDKQTFVMPTFTRVLYHTAGTVWLSNTPIFALTKPETDTGTLMVKRLIDILVSSLAILITSPLMLIIWLAVRLHDRGPAIYKQERITKGGRRFKMYKFRSMVPDSGDEVDPRVTAKDDPRITPIGRFIRKTRLDELPQFFNVLLGSMSIVGPRPEWVVTAERYEKIYPNFAFRTKVKAGITGFAQVYGRHNTPPEDKLFLDIMYIETFSILQDIKLMLQTISVLFKPSSTEGFQQ